MSSNHSAPKEYLTLYRDGSLGSALIEAMDELILAGRLPIIPGAALDHPINLTTEPTGSEAGNPIDLAGTTTTTESSSPTINRNTSTSTCPSSSSSSTTTPTDLRPQLQSQPQQQRQQSLASLTHKLTDHVLTTFDRVIAQTIATHDEVINKIPVIKMKGKLKQYRLVDDIWKLWVEDVEIAVGSEKRRRRRGRAANVKVDLRDGGSGGGGGKGELGAKRRRDEHEDGDSEERAEKRSRGDGGNGIEVIKVDKLLIVACDGREPDAGNKKKKRGG